MKDGMSESTNEVATVSAKAMQATSGLARDWVWIDRSIWTERMLAALDNGVKGNAYFAAQGLFTMTEARTLASQPR